MCQMSFNQHKLHHKWNTAVKRQTSKTYIKEASLCGPKPHPSPLLYTSFSTVSTFRCQTASKWLTDIEEPKISCGKKSSVENLHRKYAQGVAGSDIISPGILGESLEDILTHVFSHNHRKCSSNTSHNLHINVTSLRKKKPTTFKLSVAAHKQTGWGKSGWVGSPG